MPFWKISFLAIIYQSKKSSWFSPKFACEQPKRHFQDFSIFSLDGKSMWKTFCNEQIVVHLIFHCFSGKEQKVLKKSLFFCLCSTQLFSSFLVFHEYVKVCKISFYHSNVETTTKRTVTWLSKVSNLIFFAKETYLFYLCIIELTLLL